MTLKNLRQNINEEREIATEIVLFSNQVFYSAGKEKEMLSQTIDALAGMLSIINNSVAYMIENISPIKRLKEGEEEVKGLVSLSYGKGGLEKSVTISESDRKKFLEELRLLDFSLKRIKKEPFARQIAFKEFKKPSSYARISNKLFSQMANKLVEKRYFNSLNSDLRKANMPFIVNTYVAIILFSTFLSLIFSVILFAVLIFFKLSINPPSLISTEFSSARVARNLLVFLVVPALTFFSFYYYPYTERESIGKRVNQELPFVVIHMSAIAGSGIEPTQIFKIIALGKEYPYMKQELKKVMNQVNFFGYDLVNALKNSAKSAPSEKLAELFNGLASTISSGGSLTEFLDKRAETLLFDYKLERDKSTKMAESFMDIYISVVIAAPMIMMLLMILMSSGIVSLGLGVDAITLIIISIVTLVNIVFLVFLRLRQPVF